MNKGARLFLLSYVLAWFGVGQTLGQTTDTITALDISPNPACRDQIVTFTVVVRSNPAGLGTPTGTVDFMESGGVFDTQTLDPSGQASISFEAPEGLWSISARYNGDASFSASTSSEVALTVNTPPAVLANPTNQAVCAGSSASFTAMALGSPTPTIQWQVSTNGGATFLNLANATNNNYTVATGKSDNAKQYRVQFSNTCGVATSAAAILTVNALPTAAVSGGGTICPGSSATLQAALTGVGPWALIWSDGLTQPNVAASPATRNVSPTSTTVYSVTTVTDANCSSSGSGSATVTLNAAPTVTLNPANKAVCAGNSASFTATATASPAPTVQWQVSADGGSTFQNVPNATSATYTFAASGSDDGKQYRAQFSNACGLATSTAATLTVNALPNCSITGADAVCASSLNNFYAGPAGLTGYRWSVSGSAALSGPTNATSVGVNAGVSGTFTLTLVLTNASGCTSTCSKTVTNLALPTAVVSGGGAICPGGSTNIQATLSGAGPWTLLWSDGYTQPNVVASPATRSVGPLATTSYSVTSVTDAHCSSSGSGGATVTLNAAPVVTVNPADKAVCAGGSVSFTASASGSPSPGVQWQVSVDGGVTFGNVAGATSATYTFAGSASDSGKRFRVLFSNLCGSAVSSSASLVVNALPSAVITANSIVCANSTGNLASVPSAGAGATYAWTVSGGTITSGAGTSSITYTAGGSGSVNISASVTTAQGCFASGSQSVAFAVQGKALEGWKSKAPLQWQSSTFNDGDHQYSEGNTLPMRLELTQMCPGASWCIVLQYAFKDGNTSRHFYDFLSTYNASEPTVNGQACNSFNCGGAPTTYPIPMDNSLGYQLPGNFTVYNGAITNISPYTTVSGSTIYKQLIISGVTASSGGAHDVLILFGGHLARENEWGPGNGASSFPGASAKVLYQFCGESSFGNFSVNPSGIIKQADLSITKTASPNPMCAGNTLNYTLVVANSGPNQASPVTVLDSLPAGTTLSSVSLSQGTYSGTTSLNFALGALNAGSNATIMVVVAVNTNAVLGSITNTATVSAGAPSDPYMLNNTATAVTMVFPHPSATPLVDQVVCRGAPVTFSTIAVGAPPFSYQWTRNGANLPGATNSDYSIPSVGVNDPGVYCVIVSGQCNGVFDTVTNCASLILSTNASTTPLSDLTKCPGENATFSTTPAGTGPFAYVWKKDGAPIPGATLNALTLAGVTSSSAGAYCVEVSGACGSATSCAVLTVLTNTTATSLISQAKCPGEAATFATVASGSGPFTYVWKKDGVILPGQTGSSLTFPAVTADQAGSYCVEVTGNCNSVTNCADLTVKTTTTTEPLVSQTHCPGDTVTFSTTPAGTGPFSFVWKKDGAPIPGATLNTLTLTNVTAASAGAYLVEVAGACGATNSSALLTVLTNTTTTALDSQVKCPGEMVTFSTVASGTGPFTYVWKKDGATIPGATRSSLTLSSASAAITGSYCVEVTGNCNSVTNCADLSLSTPTTADPLASLTNCPGGNATFSTTAHGDGPFAYQWAKNGAPLAGRTGSSLTLPNLTTDDAGTYSVRVTGLCNSVTNFATLTVNQNAFAAGAPLSVTNCPGTSASFSVTAGGTGPFSYQWYKGGNVLPGQTGSSLILPAVTAADAGTYRVVLGGVCGNPVTNSASLVVNVPTTVDAPISQTVCSGGAASFSTTAHGTGPFGYQWLKNGVPLPGRTGNSISLSGVASGDAGTYTVQVTGACNTATQSALLTVNTLTTADAVGAQTVCPGAALSLGTTAHGTGPFTYKWIKDGKPLPGGTASSWPIASATVLDEGTYVVIVTGACNAATNTGTLTVHPPTTATPLADQTLCFGGTATFRTTAAGTGPFSYLWRKNGVALDGQTGKSLTIQHLKASDAGTYSVQVTGLCDSTNHSATLTIASDGLISPATFANPSPITLGDFRPATPYPSTIEVSCVPSPLTQVTVTLTGLSHGYDSDIDILLVGPAGQAILLMSDIGEGNPINNVTLGFSDTAPNFLPDTAPVVTGIYKPTDYSPEDNLPVPAPLGPYATTLAAFNGSDANGTWSLYVVDDALVDTGIITGGWSLTLGWEASAPPFQLLPPTLMQDGSAQLTLQAQPGKTYVIEASSDLAAWTPILTNTLSGATWGSVDLRCTNFPNRFYRAVLKP